jgi:hypothetical protein
VSDPKFTTPSDIARCGKAQLAALLELEPNMYIRGVIAEHLIEYLTAQSRELKHTQLRPSQQLVAVKVAEELSQDERDTPIVPPPIEPVRRHPNDDR